MLMNATGDSLAMDSAGGRRIALPAPSREAGMQIERTLQSRRSVRDFAPEPLTLAQVSQLLWAAQGLTSPEGFRTAPSAGALYPLEVYLVVGDVSDLAAGVYAYDPRQHALELVAADDRRRQHQ